MMKFNISQNKIEAEKKRIIRQCKKCNGSSCSICVKYTSFIDKMAESNIPVDYWFRSMDKFYGQKEFGEVINNYLKDIEKEYLKGMVLCFVGPRGTGKTMAGCSILKEALVQNYNVFYFSLTDMIDLLISESYWFRSMLREWDFIVIDEVDQRHFNNPGSRDLYSRHFEDVIRIRTQNRLPTIICTNSQDPTGIFEGEFKKSFVSLQSQFFRTIRAGGLDARTGKEKFNS